MQFGNILRINAIHRIPYSVDDSRHLVCAITSGYFSTLPLGRSTGHAGFVQSSQIPITNIITEAVGRDFAIAIAA
ncbi:hypothetical protein D3C85_777960 [compost metagenome]